MDQFDYKNGNDISKICGVRKIKNYDSSGEEFHYLNLLDSFNGEIMFDDFYIPRVYKGKNIVGSRSKVFAKLNHIKNLYIPKTFVETENYYDDGKNDFRSLTNIEHIYVEDGNPTYKVIDDFLIENTYLGPTLVLCIDRFKKVANIPSCVKIISEYAFTRCKSLEKVIFNRGNEIINSKAFRHCNNLQCLSGLNNIKRIFDFAFSDCSLIDNVKIPTNAEFISKYAFNDSGLTKLLNNEKNKMYSFENGFLIENRGKYKFPIQLLDNTNTIKIPDDCNLLYFSIFNFEYEDKLILPRNLKRIIINKEDINKYFSPSEIIMQKEAYIELLNYKEELMLLTNLANIKVLDGEKLYKEIVYTQNLLPDGQRWFNYYYPQKYLSLFDGDLVLDVFTGVFRESKLLYTYLQDVINDYSHTEYYLDMKEYKELLIEIIDGNALFKENLEEKLDINLNNGIDENSINKISTFLNLNYTINTRGTYSISPFKKDVITIDIDNNLSSLVMTKYLNDFIKVKEKFKNPIYILLPKKDNTFKLFIYEEDLNTKCTFDDDELEIPMFLKDWRYTNEN